MNILFFLIVGGLILIAFLLILTPLWRKQNLQETDIDQRNILIAQHRLQELKDNKQSGVLTEAQYNEQLADLEQALSDDLDIKSSVSLNQTQSRWMVWVVAIVLPVLEGGIYAGLGNFEAVSHTAEMAIDQQQAKADEVNKMVKKLADKMQANPNDGQGWLMLGRSYTVLKQFPQAVEALGNAYRILGDQVDVMLLYADALAYVNDKNLTGKPTELVFKALALEPDNLNALWLGGMAKAQQGELVKATELWKKLEGLLSNDPDAQKEVQDLIAKLATEMPAGQTSTEATTDSSTPAPASAQTSENAVTVEVSLAPELQASISDSDTVFIYAQALTGPKMPLAIVRKQVTDLPIKVSLDDTMAMMPNMKISSFTEVKLLARVSKSGNAISQPGDLIGSTPAVAITDKTPHQVVISETLK